MTRKPEDYGFQKLAHFVQHKKVTGGVYHGWMNGRGEREGKGVMVYYQDGNVHGRYEGDWKNDLQDGFGIRYDKNGFHYEGQFKNGTENGRGTTYDPKGRFVYSGEYSSGKLQGKGKIYCTTEKGKTFVHFDGDFFKGVPHGKGIIHFQSHEIGDRYEGSLVRFKRYGWGVLHFTGFEGSRDRIEAFFDDYVCTNGKVYGQRYKGGEKPMIEFQVYDLGNGYMKGILNKINEEERYVGESVNLERNGFGKLEFSNGDRYEGYFQNDVYHGKGFFFEKSGEVSEQLHFGGTLVSSVRIDPERGKSRFFLEDEKQRREELKCKMLKRKMDDKYIVVRVNGWKDVIISWRIYRTFLVM